MSKKIKTNKLVGHGNQTPMESGSLPLISKRGRVRLNIEMRAALSGQNIRQAM